MKALRSILITSVLLLSACGGSGGGGGTPIAPPPPSIAPPPGPVMTGVITPVPIEGLRFSTPSLTGVTSVAGEFDYREGESITLAMGATELGTVEESPELSLFDLRRSVVLTDIRMINNALGGPESSYTASVNALRILYSLDDDQNPDTGISVTPDVTESLDLQQSPRRFAYSAPVKTLLNNAGRKMMPLEIVLSHHYEEAGLSFTQDGLLPSRRVHDNLFGGYTGNGVEYITYRVGSYSYDRYGSLERHDRFDEAGNLIATMGYEYDDQGLLFRRTIDDDADGLIDFEAVLMRNHAGDVIQEDRRSINEHVELSTTITMYDDLGRVRTVTDDQGSDGDIESLTTTDYLNGGLTARITASSTAGSVFECVIINTYDDSGLLREQSFEGTGIDQHDFLDTRPPPIGVDYIDTFDPRHPYWGVEAAFLALNPSTSSIRHTVFERDNLGRVFRRTTDRNGDGEPDQVAFIRYEEHGPVYWSHEDFDGNTRDMRGIYRYTDDGLLEEAIVRPLPVEGVFERKTIIYRDSSNRREFISIGRGGTFRLADSAGFSYEFGALSDSRFSTIFDDSWEWDWERSYRIDDSILYGLTPARR
ncbi:MAG: hypothetical protein AAF749_11180 [Pseudomonadota bacterium]